MQRPILAYHCKMEERLRGELSCGHGRLSIPTSRPSCCALGASPGGAWLGCSSKLDCLRCDRFELPEGFAA